MAGCPHCPSHNIKRTQPGAVMDDYFCRDCQRPFSRLSPAAKRIALITGFTILTGGLDAGAAGGFIASLFLGGDGDA
jgi:transposase-like protein